MPAPARSSGAWAGLLTGLLVVVAVPLGWTATRPPAAVGTLPVPAASPAVAARDLQTPPDPVPPEPPPEPSPEAAPSLAPPVRVAVPAIGVDAPVVPVGVIPATGEMEIPGDVDEIGWYTPGPAPGSGSGSAVLSGHVDSRAQGEGAFFSLEQVQPGDEVLVTLADGSALAYRVEARRRYPKSELPTWELFAATGPPRLVLVTCGGAFDTVDRQYSDNVVVYALPL